MKRTDMRRQPAQERIHNFNEVALGYSEEEALAEANRCIQCKKPACVRGCPVEIDIPSFIARIKEKDFQGAISKIKEKNSLPAVCGRVCPQENQCEKTCILGKKGEPVAIGRLERFVADREMKNSQDVKGSAAPAEQDLQRVAVIGSGPGGLTCAAELAREKYKVTLFEALHKPGGVLTYGIPEFRLPKAVVEKEIGCIKNSGVEIKTNYVIGKILTLNELFSQGCKAIFVAIGAGLPRFMGIPGENLNGVYSANEFLTRVNLMKAYLFPGYSTPIKRAKVTAVVGGGNVAMDSARTSLRLGAYVFNIYRRSRREMPARDEEIENAREEGVDMQFLTNPVEILGDEQGRVRGVRYIRMELGEPDESGRRRPVPVKNSEFELKADEVVMAIGAGANPLLTSVTPELKTDKRGYIIVDGDGATSRKGVWAGGDIVTGSATVIEAMGMGKRAAASIDRYLKC